MTSPFHPGEREVQRRAGVADEARAVGRIIGNTLTPAMARFLARQRLAVAATLDDRGRPWASPLTGVPGFITTLDTRHLHIAGSHAIAGDVGLLVLDPRTRQRVRVNGVGVPDHAGTRIETRQVYGNCPKYIQLRAAEPDGRPPATARAPRVHTRLGERQRAWIERADTLFLATFHPEAGADASHRGGMPGFVRVEGAARIVFPDYPGNAMFNSLGNVVEYPRAGFLFVDFTTGDALQVTGRAQLQHDRTLTLDAEETRETKAATTLRFRLLEYSPANPRVTPRPGAASNEATKEDGHEQTHPVR
jgi:predicted pyridoxine 5'-phosphate oxidase superfamily flavin-nucleotide-binding protein